MIKKCLLVWFTILVLLLSFGTSACAEAASYRYTSGFPEDVAIHCTESVMDMMSIEDLSRLVGMIKYSVEPQAVELLRTSFPAFEEAARMGQLGTQIGFEIIYDETDFSLAAVSRDLGLDDVDEYYFRYKLTVNATNLVEKDAAGNPVRDPGTGKLRLITDRETLAGLCCTITHEMMHAFMEDYNRSGMSGIIDPEMASLPAYASDEEVAAFMAHSELVTFPRWFTEGCATAVENEYAYRQESFDDLRYYASGSIDSWYSPENLQYVFAATAIDPSLNLEELEVLPLTFDINVNIYVTGYLACLYLSELAVNSEGSSACRFDPDGFPVVDSAVLRSGLSNILRMLHEGLTLDDIIYNISGGRFYDTADFEYAFIVDDYDSAVFCSDLLNCFLRISRENGRCYPANGSLLYPFDVDYLTQIDYTKTAVSDLYRIVDSCDYVDSTADLQDVTDAGKSLSYWEYWNNAMVGAGAYYDDYYNEPYNFPEFPVYAYGT